MNQVNNKLIKMAAIILVAAIFLYAKIGQNFSGGPK